MPLSDITTTVLITESTARADVDRKFAELEQGSWPQGLLLFSTLLSTDDDTVLTYTQRADGQADHEFTTFADSKPVEYRLYRHGETSQPPGCVVAAEVEFDGPDPERQRRWVDTALDVMATETEPIPGGISGYFHVSTDGTRAFDYAEWTSEQAHRDALARSADQGVIGTSSEWRRVQEFPGVKAGGFKRYHPPRTLTAPADGSTPVDSSTGWVASHVRAYVETDGRDGHLYQGRPTLLLQTDGAATCDDDRDARHGTPSWFGNIVPDMATPYPDGVSCPVPFAWMGGGRIGSHLRRVNAQRARAWDPQNQR